MAVRPAATADVPAILPMVREICRLHRSWDPAKYGYLPDVLDRYALWLPERAADPRSVLLVADDAGTLAGFIVGTVESEIPIYDISELGFIHDMWVEPTFRRRGLATRLVSGAVQRFLAMGVKQVRLDTAVPNQEARELFERAGFRACAVQMLREI
ncbi:MAG: GNAT family N-acetyltransferase [Planctomycetes bacterium]|nr:GNAT family N-acetyltransferase [Planctomycetota bacterium]